MGAVGQKKAFAIAKAFLIIICRELMPLLRELPKHRSGLRDLS